MTDSYIQYMRDHPPRRVAPLVRLADEIVATTIIADYGEYTAVFAIRCPCGQSDTATHLLNSTDGSLTGLVIICPDCGKETKVFDPATDGYSGEFGFGDDQPTQHQTSVNCSTCGSSKVRLHVGFQYSGGDEELDDAEEIARKQDFYGWFVAYIICPSCTNVTEVAGYECA